MLITLQICQFHCGGRISLPNKSSKTKRESSSGFRNIKNRNGVKFTLSPTIEDLTIIDVIKENAKQRKIAEQTILLKK
jgi:hypothetical protein